ncbi:MAG: HPr(Ser) kinase/phosphatase [Clostridia bacterium]|nr:HPr(Ser) kinase/phosphatase [Oscillospiraceae bacterium]MBR6694026.1 HPr(Ser) kinase/phosphatase [Clostridia bacterium]
MKKQFTVSLSRIMKEFTLETVYMPGDADEILIGNTEINRPGLQLSGYFEYFDNQRIQVLGRSEISYLYELPEEKYLKAIDEFMATKPAAVIITRSIEVRDELLKAAEQYGVPLLRTGDSTSGFLAALISFLNVQLAPRITRHGVLVEVFGEGILLLGESGVGKSETAIELVNRGHRLIADDAVEIRRVSSKSLVGSSPENIRHFIELRGIGIINASRIFGVGAVKPTEKIDLVINIEPWDSSKVYDRMGLEDETTEILGISLPSITVPVKPGRNLAVIIEVAARNNRQKKLGYNAAQALLERLGMSEAKSNNANDKTGYSDF